MDLPQDVALVSSRKSNGTGGAGFDVREQFAHALYDGDEGRGGGYVDYLLDRGVGAGRGDGGVEERSFLDFLVWGC